MALEEATRLVRDLGHVAAHEREAGPRLVPVDRRDELFGEPEALSVDDGPELRDTLACVDVLGLRGGRVELAWLEWLVVLIEEGAELLYGQVGELAVER